MLNWFKNLFSFDRGFFCIGKHKVGEVAIVVTRNIGTPEEFVEDHGTHDVYELNVVGQFFQTLTNKLEKLNAKLANN